MTTENAPAADEPVKPSREDVTRTLHAEVCCPCDPTGCDVETVMEMRYADAVLALWPGRSVAEVKAEALREAADAVDLGAAYPEGLSEYHNAEAAAEVWLRDYADRIERGES